MGVITKFQNWTASHNPKWLALFRVALGVALLLRGVAFLNDLPELEKILAQSSLHMQSDWLVHTIPWVHIAGGFLIIIGLFTRFGALIQLPVLLGAILFVNFKGSIFSVQSDLPYSIIILLLALVFIVEGSGPLSLARYFKEDEEEEAAAELAATAAE